MKTHARKQNQKNKLKKQKILFAIPLLLIALLFFTACGKEKKDEITYYKIKGEGYVFDTLNNQPEVGATVIVSVGVEGESGLFGNYGPKDETYTTDTNGYYQIRFMKQYKNLKVIKYIFELRYDTNGYKALDNYTLYSEDIENAKQNIIFDTIKIPQEILY